MNQNRLPFSRQAQPLKFSSLLAPAGLERRSPVANRYSLLRFDPSLGEAAVRELAEQVIRGKKIFNNPLPRSEGRSVFIQRPDRVLPQLPSEFDQFKLKGAKLCRQDKGGIVLSEPNHLQPYPVFGRRPGHLAIDLNLDSSIVPPGQAFNGSLEEVGGLTEFKAEKIANKHGIAFPPIFAIKLKHDSQSIKNGRDQDVAIVCLGHSSKYLELIELYPTSVPFRLAKPHWSGVTDREAKCLMQATPAMPKVFLDSREMASSIAKTMATIGQAKRILYKDCHIARHVGHRGNIYIRPDNAQIALSDFDHVLILPENDRRAWGSQLLRDLFVECLRIGVDAVWNFNVHEAEQLRFGLNNSISPFLSNLFAGARDPDDFSRLIDSMLASMSEVARYKILWSKEAIVSGAKMGQAIPAFCSIASVSQPLLEICYNLIKDDAELKSQGYELVDLSLSQRSTKFQEMIRQYQRTFEV